MCLLRGIGLVWQCRCNASSWSSYGALVHEDLGDAGSYTGGLDTVMAEITTEADQRHGVGEGGRG